jgi:pyruvate/2-oxoglutarate dehydrogenase complex dihydrolipoamide acyltransferase (E2) component
MRGSTWIWLCPKHQYGRQQLDVEHPQPRPGNVWVSVQDLHEDIYGALADMWPSPVVLPLGVPAGASAAPAGADHEVIFSDYELYTVPDALLLHPLQLPELMEVEEGGDSDPEAEERAEERAPPARPAPRSSNKQPRQAAAAAAAAIAAEAASAPKATGCGHTRRCVAATSTF